MNFIATLLTLPRLSYPVPRAESRERPDMAALLHEMHSISQVEACHLIDYVLMEARELALSAPVDQNKPNLDVGFFYFLSYSILL